MTSPQKHFLLIVAMLFSYSFSNAQITKTVGQSGGDYTTLKAAFDAINSNTLSGNVSLEIIDNTIESTAPTLYGNDMVGSVTIINGGSGYSAATTTVTFSAPPAGGITATGTATVSGGIITGISLIKTGQGYTSPPTITITSTGSGVNATATAVMPTYTSVKIYPTVAGKTIFGSTVYLSGADNVIIDGRLNQTGNTVDLTINNNVTATNSFASTLNFSNDATHNTVKYVKLMSGAGTQAYYGSVVNFAGSSGGTLGNSDNTISNCELTGIGPYKPYYVVYSSGSTNAVNQRNNIINNKFYDHWVTENFASAINISSGSDGFVIANNSFYATTPVPMKAASNANSVLISINSGTHTIRENYIGGTAPYCGGGPYRCFGNGGAIWLILFGSTATGVSSIQGNVISNWEINGPATPGGALRFIDASNASHVDIGTEKGNILGSASRVNDIVCTNFNSIQAIGSGGTNSVVNVKNNTISGITMGFTSTPSYASFTGINIGYGLTTIENNTIGSETLPYSIYASSNALATVQNVTGINCSSLAVGTKLIKNNTIANLVNASINAATPGTNGNGYVHGIDLGNSYATDVTIENNRIHDLSIGNTNNLASNYSSVIGISSIATNISTDPGNTIIGNSIYNLKNTNPTFAGVLYGVYYYGNSATYISMISKNYIYNISADALASNAKIEGIYINGRAATLSNNVVSLGGNHQYNLYGIYDTSNSLLYHNTVYIQGNATGGAAFSYALYGSSPTISDYRNNLLFNARSNTGSSGKHYGIYFSVASPTITTMDYNNYWVTGTGGVLGYKGGDKTTLALWKTATGKEVNSTNVDPQLDSPGGTLARNYKPNAIALSGSSITGITTDYLGITRASPPTIGALEYCLNTATLTSFSPTSGALGNTIIITGSNFTPVTKVAFNGQSAQFTIDSSNQISVTVPTGASTGKITITTSCGDVVSGTDFMVTNLLPTITSFTPSIASVGTTVTVTGTNFTGATAVTINGMEIPNFVIDSATQIHFVVPSSASTGIISVSTPTGTGGVATSATSLQILADLVVSTQKNGIANGSIRIFAYGGLSPYTYAWSPSGGTASIATGLAPGTYTCTITDANASSITKTMTLSSPTALTASTSQTNPLVYGGATGTATVTASGGVFPYSYLWSPSGGTAATATGLVAGTYSCRITDAANTVVTKSITITQPTQLTATTTKTDVLVYGNETGIVATGVATVTASGGVPFSTPLNSYIYLWSPLGGTAATASGLAAGTYTCTITDAYGVAITKTVTIANVLTLSLTSSQTNNTIFGGATGSATVAVSNGVGPYTYSWSPSGGTAATATGLVAGTYTCSVTDSAGTTGLRTVTITQPAVLAATTAQTNVAIYGNATGTATVTASGGVSPYTYAWSPSGGSAATATGLVAGAYTCTITDANGATLINNFTITQPSQLVATTTQTNIAIYGNTTGSATVTASGGVSPYTYAWSPSGGTAATATGLAAGTYSCTIADANGATLVKTVTITQPAVLAATTIQTNVVIYGGTSGTATVTASGGVSPYTYAWSPSGGTAATATGLAAGIYTCTITDANGTTLIKNFTITQPSQLAATTSQTNNIIYGGATGSATVAASGGVSPYTYAWSPSGGTAATATVLAAGVYTCTITDANGATLINNFTITQPSQLAATTSQTNNTIYGGATGSATVAVSGGVSPYNYAWSPSGGTAATATGLVAGTFTCTITDANGATLIKTFIITQSASITQAPVLSSPSSNTNTGATIQISYNLPEIPLPGSVRLIFIPTGGTPIIWTMSDVTTAIFTYSVGTNPTLLSNVVSGLALPFTAYNVTLSYQNSTASPVASTTNTNIQTLTPPNLSIVQTNFNGVVGGTINPIIIQNTGGAATFTITPNLPNGLTLNSVTGEISGRPTAPLATTSFTVTVSNGAGTRTIGFSLFIDQDTDSDGLLNAVDPDDDNDGILDNNDAFPLDRTEWKDTDHDGIGDNADTDDDNDDILDACDVDSNGDGIPDNGTDMDHDGIIDSCDPDTDGDGVLNTNDNCPTVANANQADRDHDGLGDACDTIELNTAQGFTPNGDGINDTWVVYNLVNHPHSTVRVFTANGAQVFYSSNYQNDWSGNYQGSGEMLPVGSYLYQIDLGSDGSIDEQGWIYITK